jgi:CDP-diacylglycerol--glycerol-3-phosphate 3-phosphatidyltransferase
VSGLRSLAAAKNIIISATIWGKLKTIAQIVAIVATILNLPIAIFGGKIETILMFIAVVITIISGFDYFIKARDVFNKNDIEAGGE